jgi:hypothetical protein
MCLPADCCFSEQALKMRNGARFITGDYKSRHEGAVTNMLKDLDTVCKFDESDLTFWSIRFNKRIGIYCWNQSIDHFV